MKETRNVAILIFHEVEVLDFCGPFEVFSVTGRRKTPSPFNVYTIAEETGPILARNRMSVNPHHALSDCPTPDILVVPGGWGTRQQMNNPPLIHWIKETARKTELVLSVCTGALLLARAGLLEGLVGTTHHGALDLLREIAPRTTVVADRRFVDNGKVILSGGIATGIDMSLHVVARLLGSEEAMETAKYMEYEWRYEP